MLTRTLTATRDDEERSEGHIVVSRSRIHHEMDLGGFRRSYTGDMKTSLVAGLERLQSLAYITYSQRCQKLSSMGSS